MLFPIWGLCKLQGLHIPCVLLKKKKKIFVYTITQTRASIYQHPASSSPDQPAQCCSDASCTLIWFQPVHDSRVYRRRRQISSYLEFFQYFVRFPAIFAKVLDLLALRAAAIVLHFSALRVQFGALGLVAHRPVLRAHARTVGVSRIEALPEFVDEAAVVHAAFPPVVIENDAVSGAPLRLVRGVILGVTHRGGRHGTQSQQEHKGGREEGGHPCEHNPHSVGA